jgi:hypothetical protein
MRTARGCCRRRRRRAPSTRCAALRRSLRLRPRSQRGASQPAHPALAGLGHRLHRSHCTVRQAPTVGRSEGRGRGSRRRALAMRCARRRARAMTPAHRARPLPPTRHEEQHRLSPLAARSTGRIVFGAFNFTEAPSWRTSCAQAATRRAFLPRSCRTWALAGRVPRCSSRASWVASRYSGTAVVALGGEGDV